MRERRQQRPIARALAVAAAALGCLALGVIGAVAFPVSRPPFDVNDCGPREACFPPSYHPGLRVLSLVGGVLLALALGLAAHRAGARRSPLGPPAA